jgi:hypothetical protein
MAAVCDTPGRSPTVYKIFPLTSERQVYSVTVTETGIALSVAPVEKGPRDMDLDRKSLRNFFETTNLLAMVVFLIGLLFSGSRIGYDWVKGQLHAMSSYAVLAASLCLPCVLVFFLTLFAVRRLHRP